MWKVFALDGCETWTLKAVDKRQIRGFEMTAYLSAVGRRIGPIHQCYKKERTADNFTVLQPCDSCQKFVHRNAGKVDVMRKRVKPRRRWTPSSDRTVAECWRLPRDRQQWRTLMHEVISYPWSDLLPLVVVWRSGYSALALINEVNQRRAG